MLHEEPRVTSTDGPHLHEPKPQHRRCKLLRIKCGMIGSSGLVSSLGISAGNRVSRTVGARRDWGGGGGGGGKGSPVEWYRGPWPAGPPRPCEPAPLPFPELPKGVPGALARRRSSPDGDGVAVMCTTVISNGSRWLLNAAQREAPGYISPGRPGPRAEPRPQRGRGQRGCPRR